MTRSPRRRLGLVVAAIVALLCAACSSSGASTSSSPAAAPSDGAKALAARVQAGLAEISSAHLEIDLGSLGGTSSEDLTFADGALQAARLTLHTDAGPVEIITVHDTSYAKLPAAENDSPKPWVLMNAKSTNPAVTKLAGALSLARATASLEAISGYIRAAKTVRTQGTEQVNAAPATRYKLVIEPSAVDGNAQLKQMLQLLGKSEIPVQLWVDEHARPVKFSVHITVGGEKISIQVTITKYNAPLQITAPPADQVSTG